MPVEDQRGLASCYRNDPCHQPLSGPCQPAATYKHVGGSELAYTSQGPTFTYALHYNQTQGREPPLPSDQLKHMLYITKGCHVSNGIIPIATTSTCTSSIQPASSVHGTVPAGWLAGVVQQWLTCGPCIQGSRPSWSHRSC